MFTFFCHFVPSSVASGFVLLPILFPVLAIFIYSFSLSFFDIRIWSIIWGSVLVSNLLNPYLAVGILHALSRCPVACFDNLGGWGRPRMLNALFNNFLAIHRAIKLDHGDFEHINSWGSLLERDVGSCPLISLLNNFVSSFILYNNIFIILFFNRLHWVCDIIIKCIFDFALQDIS